MKKLAIILHNGLSVDDWINEHTKHLEENEYFTIETRIGKYWKEYRIYINDDQLRNQ